MYPLNIIYPSCSELIVKLGVTDKEEILNTLKAIMELTGTTLVTYDYITLGCQYPNWNPEESIIEEPVSLDDIEIKKDKIGIPIERIKTTLLKLSLKETAYRNLAPICLLNKLTGSRLYVRMETEAFGHGLQIQAEQHCTVRNFPDLVVILRKYYDKAKWITYDGGSPYDFIDWSKDNDVFDLVKNTYVYRSEIDE